MVRDVIELFELISVSLFCRLEDNFMVKYQGVHELQRSDFRDIVLDLEKKKVENIFRIADNQCQCRLSQALPQLTQSVTIQTAVVAFNAGGRQFDVTHSFPSGPDSDPVRFTAKISYANDDDYIYAGHGPMNLCRQQTEDSYKLEKLKGVKAASKESCNSVKIQEWSSSRWCSDREYDEQAAIIDPQSFRLEGTLKRYVTCKRYDGVFAGRVIDDIFFAISNLAAGGLPYEEQDVDISHNPTKRSTTITFMLKKRQASLISQTIATLLKTHMADLQAFNPQKLVSYFVDFGPSLALIVDHMPHTDLRKMTAGEWKDFKVRLDAKNAKDARGGN